MSWENTLKAGQTNPEQHTFDVVVGVEITDIDSDVVEFHMEQGSDLNRIIHEAIVEAVSKSLKGKDTFEFQIDLSEIESDMEELEIDGFDTLDNNVSAYVSEVGMSSRDSRYPSY
tara:strand:- start:94 stop:438 length:345 start_codon:yes stop_codon:yes gene_type:complete